LEAALSVGHITIWHIGGEGQIGPAQAIIDLMPGQTKLVTFDARPEHGLPLCFDESEGEADFYINRNAMSSSLLRADPAMADESIPWDETPPRTDVWGDISATERTVRVRTTSVDAYAKGDAPDVLSIDAQGAEMRILRGAENTLSRVLALVTEVEFHPIYEHQGLLEDQIPFLRAHGFRLAGIENLQYWHPTREPMGQGFLTVGEAIWLRRDGLHDLSAEQLTRLCAIGIAFKRHSYARMVREIGLAKCAA